MNPNFDNRTKLGMISSTSVDPRLIVEDMTEATYDLSPGRSPFITFIEKFGLYGPPMTQRKAMLRKYHNQDLMEYCGTVLSGNTAYTPSTSWNRFARLTITQPSRPYLSGDVYHTPQDHLVIQETGQEVEVVMTPNASKRIADGNTTASFFAFADNNLTGGTTTTTLAGTIVVKTIDGSPFKTFTTSQIFNIARSIVESQKAEPPSYQSDPIYDCNFVSHKEWGLKITRDMYRTIKTEGKPPRSIFTRENRNMLNNAKQQMEYMHLIGNMGIDSSYVGRLGYSTKGLLQWLESNVMYYNPNTTTSYERLLQNFVADCANAQNVDSGEEVSSKVYICGHDFYVNFNQDPNFQASRILQSSGAITQKLGFNVNQYNIAGYNCTLIPSNALRGKYSDWCFAIDPRQFKIRIYDNCNFTSPADISENADRDKYFMIEYAATNMLEHEQTCALLRTP